jgi:hypothetical protein
LVAALAAAAPVAAADRLAVASLGAGVVEVLWVPEDGNWPQGGWRLERVGPSGATIVARQLVPGADTGAMARLPREQSAGIAEFAGKLRQGTLTDEEREAADTVLIIAALVRPEYGRALGVRFGEINVPGGPTYYRLTALDRNGASLRSAESDLIDARAATELPHAPEAVAAAVTGQGVLLSWAEPPANDAAPIIGYRVLRAIPNGPVDLTPDLVLRATSGLGTDRPARLSFLDRAGPRDEASAYDVMSVDPFGRVSPPKRVEVALGVLARLAVPGGVAVVPGVESAVVTWTPVRQPGVAGYVVERSLFLGGPYEALTPDGLPAGAGRFESKGLRPGASYYFRVRVFDVAGELGTPSLPVKAIAAALGPPAAPRNVAAEVGPTRVGLTWEEPGAAAGYFVYRRLESERQWTRLNGTLITEPFYFDRFERGAFSQGRLLYRVQAVGFDNQPGAFSAEVTAAFGDLLPPSAPTITSVTGDSGAAHVAFAPAAPEDDSTGFLILRADDQRLPGKVVSDVLPQVARVFDDPGVIPGGGYWYEVVALDAAGNRSDSSNRVFVAVGAPSLPAPPAPRATYRATPFPYVELILAPPPPMALAYVEAQAFGGKWLVVAGPVTDFLTVNLTDLPVGTQASYRVVYQAANGVRGPPSPVVEVPLR